MKLAFNVPIAKFSDYFGPFQLVYWRLGFRESFFIGFFFFLFFTDYCKGVFRVSMSPEYHGQKVLTVWTAFKWGEN